MAANLVSRVVTLSWRLRAAVAATAARRASIRRVRGARQRRILIICHGNIYRSPFVAEYLRLRLDGSTTIRSAGFHPVPARPSPQRHIEMCRAFGVDLANHRSSVATRADFEWADVVVIMDRKNWVQARRVGATENSLIWLGALVPGVRIDIQDPYDMNDTRARALLEHLHACAEALAKELQGCSVGAQGDASDS